MTPIGMILEQIWHALPSGTSDKPLVNRVWRQLNYEYFELCRKVSWQGLRVGTPLSLDFTGADSTGLWLPSDLFGIDLAWDADNEVRFWEKEKHAAQLTEEVGYRFYRYFPSRSDLHAGTDLIVQKGGSSFTSASLTAAGTEVDGEYVTFDDEPGWYEISSDTTPFTFTPTYYGDNKTSKNFAVRPWQSTQKVCIVDPAEDLLYDRTLSVYYWRAPVALYRESDMVLLPSAEILKLRTLRAIPETRDRAGVSKSMLEEAMDDAVRSNPRFPEELVARGRHGHSLTAMESNPYGDR